MRNETPRVTFEQETLHLLAIVMTHKDGHRTWGGGQLMGPMNPLAQTNSVDNSVHHSTSLTNGDKPFNEVFNTLNGYNNSCIDRWRLIKVYIIEPKGITKIGIKAIIKATTAICYETIYKHSLEPKRGTHFWYANTPLFGYFWRSFHMLTLSLETLWQAPHQWPPKEGP